MTSTRASSRTAAEKASSDDGDRSEQHQVHRGLPDALEDERAESAAADQRRDGDESDVLHQHDADAGENDRQRQAAIRRR